MNKQYIGGGADLGVVHEDVEYAFLYFGDEIRVNPEAGELTYIEFMTKAAALEEDDPALVAAALGDIARAKGMGELAKQTGLGRESLYKALSPEGNPELATVLKVLKALGLRLHATAEH